MKVYRFTKKDNEHPTFNIDTQDLFQIKLEEFKRAFGLNSLGAKNSNNSIHGLSLIRMSHYKDKARLSLLCNPTTDDLVVIFSEWIAKQPGFRTLSAERLELLY